MFVGGSVRVPGDKSITHRALMLAALAEGESLVRGALTSLDARSTAGVLRQLGAGISPLRVAAEVRVRGRGWLSEPRSTLDCGNAGTTARLVTGILAAQPLSVRLSGDRSLRRRPMRRITIPLSQMGARFQPAEPDRLPFTLTGGRLGPLRHDLPVSSAQVKSALLLAGACGGVNVSLREPGGLSRDHTERMLRALGFDVATTDGRIELDGGGQFRPFEVDVPADPSSAAFLVGAAVLAEGGTLALSGVGLNPTRTGFLSVLERMGAAVAVEEREEQMGEPVGTLLVSPAPLEGTEVTAGEIPGLVDEVPMLAVLAARARGETRFCSVGELRVKESDRLGLIASNLTALGQRAQVEGEDLVIEGTEVPPRGRVRTDGDHRIAMAFRVLGTIPGAAVDIDDMQCADVSFPGFDEMLDSIVRRP
ncbi:MAG TPA: 3-phosphoshikimate 1-carboxyvinyltransferase [Gemmatimonadales bacterium]|jgi:3-phosphoshikimate 1-carboxyvinyltransferase|nr:3-phosphoshikimate 1-carboxyvinyltransferase [Gemmatimonadales bacterium]